MSFNVCTTFWSRSLFSFDIDSKRHETTVSSAQVSMMPVRLATESQSADSFLRPVPNEPSFNKVETVHAAGVSGRKVDRRVLATDIDAELGLIKPVFRVGSARWSGLL